jgi:hypothetical protein
MRWMAMLNIKRRKGLLPSVIRLGRLWDLLNSYQTRTGVSILGVKRPEREADNYFQTCVEVNAYNFTFINPIQDFVVVLRPVLN